MTIDDFPYDAPGVPAQPGLTQADVDGLVEAVHSGAIKFSGATYGLPGPHAPLTDDVGTLPVDRDGGVVLERAGDDAVREPAAQAGSGVDNAVERAGAGDGVCGVKTNSALKGGGVAAVGRAHRVQRGELISIKGMWWRVETVGDGVMILALRGPTSGTMKKAAAREKRGRRCGGGHTTAK